MLHPSSLQSTISTPHSSGFASLDLELFTKSSKKCLFTNASNLGSSDLKFPVKVKQANVIVKSD
jgi:hypothetical protein